MSLLNKVVIPGGAGLVGQNLLPKLQALGVPNIVIIDKHKKNLELARVTHPGVTCEYADLSEEGPWQGHFEGADAVVMLQAQIGGLDDSAFHKNNVTSTKLILQSMSKYGIPSLIHVSSSVINSTASDLYTGSKLAQEELVASTWSERLVILRPTLMFGWFDRKHLGWLARFMARVPIFPIPGHGKYIRQPLYAGDFSNIIITCLQKSEITGTFDIAGQEQTDYIDIIRKIKKVTQSNTLILRIPYAVFHLLLSIWSWFDKSPPFTTSQLEALVIPEIFPSSDWPKLFGVKPSTLDAALYETFKHDKYSNIHLDF